MQVGLCSSLQGMEEEATAVILRGSWGLCVGSSLRWGPPFGTLASILRPTIHPSQQHVPPFGSKSPVDTNLDERRFGILGSIFLFENLHSLLLCSVTLHLLCHEASLRTRSSTRKCIIIRHHRTTSSNTRYRDHPSRSPIEITHCLQLRTRISYAG